MMKQFAQLLVNFKITEYELSRLVMLATAEKYGSEPDI